MNQELTNLKNLSVLTNREILAFMQLTYKVIDKFCQRLSDGGDPDENPDILFVKSSPKSILSTSISNFHSNLTNFESTVIVPRKYVETEEMTEVNKQRLLDFGTIRKIIYTAYHNNKSNLDAQNLWFLIRAYDKIRNLRATAIHSSLTKFVTEMESDKYKANCTALKITELITGLKDKNTKYEELLLKRSSILKINYKMVKVYRKDCNMSYTDAITTANSIIKLDPFSDYSEFTNELNGYADFYKNLITVKKTRSKTKNKKPDEPNPEDPDIL